MKPNHNESPDFQAYISQFKDTLKHLFEEIYVLDQLGADRGLPERVVNPIQDLNPLAYSIPQEFGGQGMDPSRILAILEACSYESLPYSLVMGINGALFLEPVVKYGSEPLKSRVFSSFLNDKSMGGLMITEPNFGTSALGMETSYHASDKGFRITGEKHWAGLTGSADFWLMTAREKRPNGKLARDISFFVCDSSRPDEMITVKEFYENIGLLMIPYGLNTVDVDVPPDSKLIPKTSGIRMLQELLHRSRMRFPGMAIGFVKRMYDEASAHCHERKVGGKLLVSYDQVQRRLARHQSWATICSAFCKHSAEVSSVDQNLEGDALLANVHKALMSDIMHQSSQSLLQLVGAKGFRHNHIAGRSFIDSRPFQIFEGSNDVIYDQIWDATQKDAALAKESNLAVFLKGYAATAKAGPVCSKLLNFSIPSDLIQRRRIDLGLVISRVIAIDLVLSLGEAGFNGGMIDNAIDLLREEIAEFVAVFHNGSSQMPVNDEMPSWY